MPVMEATVNGNETWAEQSAVVIFCPSPPQVGFGVCGRTLQREVERPEN